MIKLLIVDDSEVEQAFLNYIFSNEPGIKVIGIKNNGKDALDFVLRKKTDVILIDINTPNQNSLEITSNIMESAPTPIVIVSHNGDVRDVSMTYESMDAGALATVLKPRGFEDKDYKSKSLELIKTVMLVSEIKTIRHWSKKLQKNKTTLIAKKAKTNRSIKEETTKIIAIGASTGGPSIIHEILMDLPKDIPFPILIGQHMTAGFEQGFADWLLSSTGFPVVIPSDNEKLQNGHIYIAPSNFNMGINAIKNIIISKPPSNQKIFPSVAYLFESVAENYGSNAIGIILSGMGKDGSEELKMMLNKGAITIAQDEVSCTVFGMPKEAINYGSVKYVMNPDKISRFIKSRLK